MNCNYDYKICTAFLTPIPISAMPNYTEERTQELLSHNLHIQLEKLIQEQEASLNTDNLEINSHSVSFVGDTVMLSVVFQRRRV